MATVIKKSVFYRGFGGVLLLHLVACAGAKSVNETDNAPFAIRCHDPRPEICTYQYTPVCATKNTGVRCVTTPCPATEKRTYGNACVACSDPKVLGYSLGVCK